MDIFSALVYYYGVQKRGRKESYIISGILMALCSAAIGIFQYSEHFLPINCFEAAFVMQTATMLVC